MMTRRHRQRRIFVLLILSLYTHGCCWRNNNNNNKNLKQNFLICKKQIKILFFSFLYSIAFFKLLPLLQKIIVHSHSSFSFVFVVVIVVIAQLKRTSVTSKKENANFYVCVEEVKRGSECVSARGEKE